VGAAGACRTGAAGETMNFAKVVVVCALISCVVVTQARLSGKSAKNAAIGFEQLKMLIGEWAGHSDKRESAQSSVRPIADGTALMETLMSGSGVEMMTIYSPDGDRIRLTHYCSSNNQPQMSTQPITTQVRQFSFDFLRAANLATVETGHMSHLVLILEDRDHFTEEWTWKANGKERFLVLHFTRATLSLESRLRK
jgi:hypothetical protein